MKSFLFLILLSFHSYAGILYTDEFKKETVHFTRYKKVQISSQRCKEKCTAKDIIDNPPKIKKIKLPKKNIQNPSSYLCQAYKGKPSIYFDEKNAEYSICIFKDQSSFLTWDFINSHD